MPVAIVQEQLDAPPSALRKKPWTRRDCEVLEKMGVFNGLRYELVEGELIDKMGINWPHCLFVTLISDELRDIFGRGRVQSQSVIGVRPEDNPTSAPQPDVCVTRQPAKAYDRHPNPSDILLVVEVADTTLDYDTTTKAGLYARAGIADYWVYDVNRRRFVVHRSPEAGAYQSLTIYEESEPVSPLAAPGGEHSNFESRRLIHWPEPLDSYYPGTRTRWFTFDLATGPIGASELQSN